MVVSERGAEVQGESTMHYWPVQQLHCCRGRTQCTQYLSVFLHAHLFSQIKIKFNGQQMAWKAAYKLLIANCWCYTDRTVLCLHWCSFCVSVLSACIFIVCFAFDKVLLQNSTTTTTTTTTYYILLHRDQKLLYSTYSQWNEATTYNCHVRCRISYDVQSGVCSVSMLPSTMRSRKRVLWWSSWLRWSQRWRFRALPRQRSVISYYSGMQYARLVV